MIVDNYSDTEIFLKFLHQILEIVIASSGYTRVILIHVQAAGQLFPLSNYMD